MNNVDNSFENPYLSITSNIKFGTINKIDFTLETLYFDQNYVEKW